MLVRLFSLLTLMTMAAGAGFSQPIPRPEYPQPQFERKLWMNLNGEWEFEFDNDDAGVDKGWHAGNKKFSRKILVPFCPESPKSGIGDTSFHSVVWYRRAFSLGNDWKGKNVLLHFGAVDYEASVFVNGRLAGRHVGGSTPFSFNVTPYLARGENTIVLRAKDYPTDRYLPRGKQFWEPKSRSIFYRRTTGIWQSVWLEGTGSSYLKKVRIDTELDGAVRFSSRVARPREGLLLDVKVFDMGKTVAAATVSAERERTGAFVVVPDPKHWEPRQPHLYDVTFVLRRGAEVLDEVSSYFGIRTVTVESGRVFLNGRPIYLKLILDQGYWPESILTPPSDEALKYDIEATMEMGFNGARKHQKLGDPRWLYWADKLGFLVSNEAANAYLYDEEYVRNFTTEWIETVERDYNHPSVILWTPINESWGAPDLRDPRQQNHLKALYRLTKSIDGTRPVIDNDGWEHTDLTDLFAFHDYSRTGELLYERYKNLGKPGAAIPPAHRALLLPGYEYNGSPFFLSEFGGIAYIPPGTEVPEESWGYSGVEKTPEDALSRLRGLYQAIAKLPVITGICYTQLTDVEQEVNGLLTFDRKMKFDPQVLREINDLLR